MFLFKGIQERLSPRPDLLPRAPCTDTASAAGLYREIDSWPEEEGMYGRARVTEVAWSRSVTSVCCPSYAEFGGLTGLLRTFFCPSLDWPRLAYKSGQGQHSRDRASAFTQPQDVSHQESGLAPCIFTQRRFSSSFRWRAG